MLHIDIWSWLLDFWSIATSYIYHTHIQKYIYTSIFLKTQGRLSMILQLKTHILTKATKMQPWVSGEKSKSNRQVYIK